MIIRAGRDYATQHAMAKRPAGYAVKLHHKVTAPKPIATITTPYGGLTLEVSKEEATDYHPRQAKSWIYGILGRRIIDRFGVKAWEDIASNNHDKTIERAIKLWQ